MHKIGLTIGNLFGECAQGPSLFGVCAQGLSLRGYGERLQSLSFACIIPVTFSSSPASKEEQDNKAAKSKHDVDWKKQQKSGYRIWQAHS